MPTAHIEAIQIHLSDTVFECISGIRQDTSITLLDDEQQIHRHGYYEFFFISENESLEIVTESEKCHYTNAVVVVPPLFKHYAITNENTKQIYFQIKETKMETALSKALLALLPTNTLGVFPINDTLLFYVNQIKIEQCTPSGNQATKLKALFTLLILSIAETWKFPVKNVDEKHTGNAYILKIEGIIREAFYEKVDLSYIAQRLFLSEKQVSRIIKKHFNCSLSDLINDNKLSVASLLLKNTEKSVSQIIEELNFQTESYFFVLFKKKYGCSPLVFRRQSKKTLKK